MKNIVSNFPTNVSVSVSFVRDRLGHHHPKRDRVAATQGRTSRMRFLDNIFRKGSAKAPVNFRMHGRGRRSRSCRGVHYLFQPSRTSFACGRGCNVHSRHNNNHSSTHVAVTHYMNNTLTGLTLHRLNIDVATCASRINDVTLRGSCRLCSLGAVRSGPIHYPSRAGTGRVRRLVTRIGTSNSAVKNVVAYIVRKYPMKLNRPRFSGLRSRLNTTVLNVGTIGKFRCKRKFTKIATQKDRRGSIFIPGTGGVSTASSTTGRRRAAVGRSITTHVAAGDGRDNNVRKKLDGNRSVCFQMTFGPMTALLVRRSAMSLRKGPAGLATHKHRSPYMLPETMPMMRTVTTVIVLSGCLLGGAIELWG